MKVFIEWFFYNFSKGLTQQQCLESLRSTFGNQSPSENTVYNWFAEFRRASVSDEFRDGRLNSVVPKNIDAVLNMIEEDRHVTYREVESSLGISKTAVHSILHEHLAVKRSIPDGFRIIWPKLKNRLVSIGVRKCSKNLTEETQILYTTS